MASSITAEPGTSVAVQEKSDVARRIDAAVASNKERNALIAAIRGTLWGRDVTPEVARCVAQYCRDNNLDAVRHVELLGGRIYLTTAAYDEKGAHLIRAGVILPDEPEYINADPRLDELAAEGYEDAKGESSRRKFLRAKYNVPEKATAAVIQRFRIASSGAVIIGVNWCGGGSKQRDPVGDAEPAKTAQTRARRRAWTQIADVIPGYAEVIRPLEIAARQTSKALPVSVVQRPPEDIPIMLAPRNDPYGNDEAPIAPAQHSDDPAQMAEDSDELRLDDLQPVRRRGNAQLD